MMDLDDDGSSMDGNSVSTTSTLDSGAQGAAARGATTSVSIESSDSSVPTVFRWEHGGRNVFITGTFNDWSRQIPMHRSGNDFTYIHNLPKGKHAFKFIVDDEWRYAPDQPTVADVEGRINNFIDVNDFVPYHGDSDFEESIQGTVSSLNILSPTQPAEDANFNNKMPDIDEYTKEPPPLPPHLRHIILNKAPALTDTASLPIPQHVALNHLYCTAIKDNMMVLGVTQRHKTKFVTTVYYSPC
jgi:5'-AMP-activated protein kinase regulatory beta subunit